MKADKIREMNDAELEMQLSDAASQIWKIRFQAATGQTEGVGKLHNLRRDVARMKTILRERERSTTDGGE